MEMKAIQKEYPLAGENSNLIIYKALKASSKNNNNTSNEEIT